jgi:hypothetical protein
MMDSRGGGGVSKDVKENLHGLIKQARKGSLLSNSIGINSSSTNSSNNSLPSDEIPPSVSTNPPIPPGMPNGPRNDSLYSTDDDNINREHAMRAFLKVLFSLAPYWKYEQFI